MTDETRKFLAKTMVFQSGNQTEIWDIHLNTLEIEEHELDEYVADGWFTHPFHVRDALAEQEAQEAQAAETARIQAEQEGAEQQRLQDEAALKAANDETVKATNEARDQLIAEAATLGIKVDNRWGIATLQEAIDEAKKSQ